MSQFPLSDRGEFAVTESLDKEQSNILEEEKEVSWVLLESDSGKVRLCKHVSDLDIIKGLLESSLELSHSGIRKHFQLHYLVLIESDVLHLLSEFSLSIN